MGSQFDQFSLDEKSRMDRVKRGRVDRLGLEKKSRIDWV